ncbi:MAG: hypothetical protein OXK80_01840 [Bdellovibrionales bacterium]|nr:hypothetical protein [Bdellovibrionales bacterium]
MMRTNTPFIIVGILMFFLPHFSKTAVCLRVDAKVIGYDEKHFTLSSAVNKSSDKKPKQIQIIRASLSKTMDKFLKMNVGNVVNECFTANSIKKE